MADYNVNPGDCFSSLAKENNYYNYLTLYKHPENGPISTVRTNPNMLVEGDVVKIPDKRQKKVALTLDKEKKFVLDRQKTKLRLALMDVEDEALKASKLQLTVGAVNAAKLAAAGLEINPTEKDGQLAFALPALPAYKPEGKTTKKGSVPAHIPEIAAKDFEDEFENDATPVQVEIALKIGYLEPHTEVRGGLQRLNNLGCKLPDATFKTAIDDETKFVIRSYQKSKGKDPQTGLIADIQSDLETAHDKV